MSSLFIDEVPVQFLPSLATKIGADKAIILQQVNFWLHNPKLAICFKGVPWIPNVHGRCCIEFVMWDGSKVRKLVDDLIETGHLLFKDFAEDGKLFTIDYDHVRRLSES